MYSSTVFFLFSFLWLEDEGGECCIFSPIPDIRVKLGNDYCLNLEILVLRNVFKRKEGREGTSLHPLRSADCYPQKLPMGKGSIHHFLAPLPCTELGELPLLCWRRDDIGNRRVIWSNSTKPHSLQGCRPQHSGCRDHEWWKMLCCCSSCGFKEMDKIRCRPTCQA